MEENYSPVSDLMRRLITNLLPPATPDHVQHNYQAYFLRILSSRMQPSAIEDEAMLKSLMQRRLFKRAEEENINKHTANAMALRLQELLQKVGKSRSLPHRRSILYLLNKIGEFNDLKNSTSVLPVESLFQAQEFQKLNQSTQLNGHQSRPLGTSTHSGVSRPISQPQHRMDIETTAGSHNMSQQRTFSTQKEQSAVKMIQKIAYKGNASLDLSESDLIREILYAFQGIDGNYISFSVHEDSYVIKSTITLPTPVKKMVYQLCEMGWLFRKVVDFLQTSNQNPHGLIYDSLCYTIRNELNEYYRLIAILDNLRDSEDEQSRSSFLLTEEKSSKSLTLRKLYLWSLEPFERLKWIAILADACKGTKGCAILSVVYTYAQQGSPTIQNLVNSILKQVLVPFADLIKAWVYQGELNDQYQEFFVRISNSHAQHSEAIWNERYKLNTSMIPNFVDKQIAENILLIGKTVNFLRKCCGVQDWVLSLNFLDISSAVVGSFTQVSKIEEFKDWVAHATALTSKKLVEVMFQKYRLKDHFDAIKKYMLIGQGDFIQALMDNLNNELGKPASSLYRHNLLSVLETAIRASNAQFHDPELLSRLDIRLLEASQGDQGWEIFSLDYKVDAPINTIFNPAVMKNYLRLFNFLWRIKRVEYSLSSIWIQHMKGAHMVEGMKDLSSYMHRCHLLRHEMIHFVKNLLEYIMVEVIEGSWKTLIEQLGEAKDLNEIIRQHENFLNTVMDRALLTQKSEHLYKYVIKLFDLTFRFKYTNEILFTSAQDDYKRRNKEKYDRQIKQIIGQDDLDEEESSVMTPKDETDSVHRTINSETVIHLKNLWKDYKEEFTEFVNLLKHEDYVGKLRFLTFRLDFNEHYCSTNPKNSKRYSLEEFKPKSLSELNPLNPGNQGGFKKPVPGSNIGYGAGVNGGYGPLRKGGDIKMTIENYGDGSKTFVSERVDPSKNVNISMISHGSAKSNDISGIRHYNPLFTDHSTMSGTGLTGYGDPRKKASFNHEESFPVTHHEMYNDNESNHSEDDDEQ